MANNSFRIVFDGEIRAGEKIHEVKERLAELFKVERERIELLFTDRPVVIKRVDTLGDGMRYVAALRKAGIISRIEREAEAPAE